MVIEFEINAQGWRYETVSELLKKIREEHNKDCELRVKVNFGNEARQTIISR